tara:strand:+ start:135 stop:1181 length:1047 start_codon:yes stop_codon:yes gene_type:complete
MLINCKSVGSQGDPVYVIAELSANHNKDYDKAVELIKIAKECGADAVKLQTYTADTITIDSDREEFRLKEGSLWSGKKLYDLYQEAYTPWDWQPKLMKLANELGMDLFSSPFDKTAVDFLEEINVPAYKIASCELVDIPLIRYVAKKNKPVLISIGIGRLQEIEEAIDAVRENGNDQIALLKCTSAYPTLPEELNLITIPDLIKRFNVPIGISDHSPGSTAAVMAVTLGAKIVEKHIALSRNDPGPDSAFSMEPKEFKEMVDSIRFAEKALGAVNYKPTVNEQESLNNRRSLYVVEDINAGEVLTENNIRSIRPGHGLLPKSMDLVLGKKALGDISRGTPLAEELIEK